MRDLLLSSSDRRAGGTVLLDHKTQLVAQSSTAKRKHLLVLERSMQHPGNVQQKSSLTQNVRPDCCGGRCCPQARRCSRVAWAAVSVACKGKHQQGGRACAPRNDTRPRFASTSYGAARDRKTSDETTRGAGSLISAQQGRCNGCRVRVRARGEGRRPRSRAPGIRCEASGPRPT
jgi:hypothetical protein